MAESASVPLQLQSVALLRAELRGGSRGSSEPEEEKKVKRRQKV